ncbi:MAG: hypothetical protein U9Q30_05065 [Campylobacterota bacterium]|nr:hypothetical protein [Campylobacterota bacterium]
MILKKLTPLSIALATMLNALDMPPMMPPMVPNIDVVENNKSKETKNKKPDSCAMIPPMVLFLPPPMEIELVKCKNKMGLPKKEFAQKQLSKLFKKDIKIEKIEIVEKFNQLYKITYNGGTILTNKSVNAFIKQ